MTMNGTPFQKDSTTTSVETVDTIEFHGSFSEAMDDSSVVSAITFLEEEEEEDEEEVCTSDRRQHHSCSLEERGWSSDPTLVATPDSPHRYDRFSSRSDHGDKMPCRMPQRKLSTRFLSSSPRNLRKVAAHHGSASTSSSTCSKSEGDGSSSSSYDSCDSFDSFAACSESASLDLVDIFGDRYGDRYNVSRVLVVGRRG
ncbi:unnamed protein product [Cylindrotheca closterium]|uniref:Uncharacterized protein n=1 Tax=Cylindrotheca closterium TaxID=2856 RepID=A0AAD2PV05_9STRA|nr:unnamed protein product [Cylindrotheca closterium]